MNNAYAPFIRIIAAFSLVCFIMLLRSDSNAILPDNNSLSTVLIPEFCQPERTNTMVSQTLSYFEPNRGQADDPVRFLSRGKNFTLYLTPDRAEINLTTSDCSEKFQPGSEGKVPHQQISSTTLSIRLTGSNPEPVMNGVQKLKGRTNYLVGGDPDRWRKDIPHYRMVKYSNVYEGIDLLYHNRRCNLECDFVLAPGMDPGRIGFAISGVERIRKDPSGNLVLHTCLGDVTMKAPETYQEIGGNRRYIASAYELKKNGYVSFRLDPYDESEPLIIDPEIIFSTYFGGTGVSSSM